jgi:DNA-binding NtrC family response regulator
VTIPLPPLRARVAEIPTLAQGFLVEACPRAGKSSMTLSPAASLLLASYRWPGNVRELRNVIERAVLLSDGDTIGVSHLMFGRAAFDAPGVSAALPSKTVAEAAASTDPTHVGHDDAGHQRILAALAQTGGNQKEAAELLGLSRRMLAYRIDKLGLPRPRKKGAR